MKRKDGRDALGDHSRSIFANFGVVWRRILCMHACLGIPSSLHTPPFSSQGWFHSHVLQNFGKRSL